jgi:hypothetical protein
LDRKEDEELAKKKLSTQECLDALVLDLKNEFDGWDHISKNGCQDPAWPDGVNMNLVHNHICYDKSNIEMICTENSLEFPEIYHRETPPEVDKDYMVCGYLDEHGRPVREKKEESQPVTMRCQSCGYSGKEFYICPVCGQPDMDHQHVDEVFPKESEESTKTCETCGHSEDYGESVEYIKCAEGKKRKDVKKSQPACNKYKMREKPYETKDVLKESEKKDSSVKRDHCGDCNFGHWYSEENTYVNVVSDDGIKTTKRPCEPHTHYCYQFSEGQKKLASDKNFNPLMSPAWCPLKKGLEDAESKKYNDEPYSNNTSVLADSQDDHTQANECQKSNEETYIYRGLI